MQVQRSGAAAETALGNREAAPEPDLGRREGPAGAALLRRQHRAARHGDFGIAILPARRGSDPVRGHVGVKIEREAVRALARDLARHLAAPAGNRRLGGEIGKVEPAIFEAACSDVGIDRRTAIGKAAGRVDIGAGNGDRRRPAKARIAHGKIDRKADRALPLGPEGQRAVHPAARQPEIARDAFVQQYDVARHVGAVDVEPVDRDPRWRVFGQEQRERAVEFAERRLPRDIQPEALLARCERDADILEARRGIGIGEHQHGARAIACDLGIEAERPVLRLPPLPCEHRARHAAPGHHLAVERGGEARGREARVAEDDRLARPHAKLTLEAHLLAREVDDRGIADAAQYSGKIGAQAPRHGGAELGENLGIGGHLTRALDAKASGGDGSGDGIGARGDIAREG